MPRTGVVTSFAITIGLVAAVVACSSAGDDGSGSLGPANVDADQAPPAAAGTRQEFENSVVFTSPSFNEKKRIPKKHTCTKISANEPNISPPVSWDNVPDGVVTFALIMDSLEGVKDAERVHWVMWNIPTDLRELTEGVEHSGTLEDGAVQGANDNGEIGYLGPCPPVIVIGQEGDISAGVFKKQQIEQYTFRIYALDAALDLPAGATRTELLAAMEGHILAGGVLVGERQGPTAFEKTKF